MEDDERLTSEELQDLMGCYEWTYCDSYEWTYCDNWDCYTDCAFWNGKRCTYHDNCEET